MVTGRVRPSSSAKRARRSTSPSPRSGRPADAGTGPSAAPPVNLQLNVHANLKIGLSPAPQKFNTFNAFDLLPPHRAVRHTAK